MSNPNNGPNVLQQILPESVTARIVAGSIAVSSVLGLGAAAELGPNASKATAAGTGENTPGLVADPASLQPEATPFANSVPAEAGNEAPADRESSAQRAAAPNHIGNIMFNGIINGKGRHSLIQYIHKDKRNMVALRSGGKIGAFSGEKNGIESIVSVVDYAYKGVVTDKVYTKPGYRKDRSIGNPKITYTTTTEKVRSLIIEASNQNPNRYGDLVSSTATGKHGHYTEVKSKFRLPADPNLSSKKSVKTAETNRAGKTIPTSYYNN